MDIILEALMREKPDLNKDEQRFWDEVFHKSLPIVIKDRLVKYSVVDVQEIATMCRRLADLAVEERRKR